MQPRLSIVIVNYNVCELLQNCIRSVYSYMKPDEAEVIVVDNCSTDNSETVIRSTFPEVKWIANSSNAGFSAANNQGMQTASGQFLLLLNPDTELREDALHPLLKQLESSAAYDIVVPRLLNSDLTLQPSAWKFPGVLTILLETFYLHNLFRLNAYDTVMYRTNFFPDAASGAALAFRREVFSSFGGFDANLFWMEDTDFCYRIRKAGGRIHYLAGSSIVHHSGKSSAKNLKVVIANQLISKVKYIRKHFSTIAFIFSCMLILIHILTRCIAAGFISLFVPSFIGKRQAYFFSLKKFWRYLLFTEENIR
ncbi:MAG TPA: glycosyltransferase family 2 protein [Bacteroidia bacterium]|nr:glycosyltransferase family 2 protein [Bacteroidia bacterium]